MAGILLMGDKGLGRLPFLLALKTASQIPWVVFCFSFSGSQ
jgi:hypothetical protein